MFSQKSLPVSDFILEAFVLIQYYILLYSDSWFLYEQFQQKLYLAQWFSTGDSLGNVWRYFWLSQWDSATGTWWVEVRDTVKHPIIYRLAPQQRSIRPQISVVLRVKRGFRVKWRRLVWVFIVVPLPSWFYST